MIRHSSWSAGPNRNRPTTGPTRPLETWPDASNLSFANCPDASRDALTRVDLDGQTHAQAAAQLGISVSGMKSRVQRARRQLKALLTGCCQVEVDRAGAVSRYRINSPVCGCGGPAVDAS